MKGDKRTMKVGRKRREGQGSRGGGGGCVASAWKYGEEIELGAPCWISFR